MNNGPEATVAELTDTPWYLDGVINYFLIKATQTGDQQNATEYWARIRRRIALLKRLPFTDMQFSRELELLTRMLFQTPPAHQADVADYLTSDRTRIYATLTESLNSQYEEDSNICKRLKSYNDDVESSDIESDVRRATQRLANQAWLWFLLGDPHKVNRCLQVMNDRTSLTLFSQQFENWFMVEKIERCFIDQTEQLAPEILGELLAVIEEHSHRTNGLRKLIDKLGNTSQHSSVRRIAHCIWGKWNQNGDNALKDHSDWKTFSVGELKIFLLPVDIPVNGATSGMRRIWVLETEVTWELLQALSPELENLEIASQEPKLPAEKITASQIFEACNSLNRKFGFVEAYEKFERLDTSDPQKKVEVWRLVKKSSGFRLPTRIEFFYLSGGQIAPPVNKDIYCYWGEYLDANANYEHQRKYANSLGSNPGLTEHDQPLPVGSLRPNCFGFRDTMGNIQEVCWPDDLEEVESHQLDQAGGGYNNDQLPTRLRKSGWFRFINGNRGQKSVGFRLVFDSGP